MTKNSRMFNICVWSKESTYNWIELVIVIDHGVMTQSEASENVVVFGI